MSKEIDTEYTDEVVCPYCGAEQGESWELADNNDDYDCNECGKVFGYERDIEVTYRSWKKEQPDE